MRHVQRFVASRFRKGRLAPESQYWAPRLLHSIWKPEAIYITENATPSCRCDRRYAACPSRLAKVNARISHLAEREGAAREYALAARGDNVPTKEIPCHEIPEG